MSDIFLRVCNLALTAGWVVLAVVVARLLLRRAPKWLHCLMWALVALRLMLPFSFESVFSLIPSTRPLPDNIATAPVPQINSGLAAVDRVINPVISATMTPAVGDSVNPMQIWLTVGSWIWLIGVGGMLLYASISYWRIARQVRASVRSDGVYLCDDVDTPFILGVIRPRIYLPSALDEADTAYVIAHERAHLRRWDHVWKPLGFLLLSVYWFQPLLWVAYVWLCRDIESACDERVIREMDGGDKKRYSEALLHSSVRRRALSACPLAFGEVGVKSRVRAVLNYKRPAFWLIVVAVVLSTVLAVGLLSDPWHLPGELIQPGTTWADEDGVLELTVHENHEVCGTMQLGDEQLDVRMLYREQYAMICAMDDPYGDAPLLECGLRARHGKLVLIISEDAVQTGIKRLTLHRQSTARWEIHTEYEGIYLTLDVITVDVNGHAVLHAKWHNDTETTANYGEPYAIEYWNGEAWEYVGTENISFTLPAYILLPGEVRAKTYATDLFDLSRAGRYRLLSHFSIEGLPYSEWVETKNQYGTWVEFEYVLDAYDTSDSAQAEIYAPVVVDEATRMQLRATYPEYFDLDTTDGLTVYVWQLAAGSYSCALLPGAPQDHEQSALMSLRATTVDEMKAILTSYRLPCDKIIIEPTHMLYSSYFYEIDDGYRRGIRAMFGLDGDPLPEKGEGWVVEPTKIVFPVSDESHIYLEPRIILTYAVANDNPWGRSLYHRVFKKCHDCDEVIEATESYPCQYNNEQCQGGCLSGR